MSKSFLHNLIAKGVLTIFNAVIPLITIPFVYRKLGPSVIGKIEYANAIFIYFSLVGMLGIYNYGLREISRLREYQEKVSSIFSSLFFIGIFSNLLSTLLYISLVYWCVYDTQLQSIMYVIGLQLIGQIFYVEWVNEAYEEFKFITAKTLIIRVISLLLILLLIANREDYLIYVWILTGVVFANNLTSFIYVQSKVHIQRFIDLRGNLKQYLMPLLLILILNNTNVLYTLVDRTMLGFYTTTEQVAYYGIGQKIAETIKALLLSVVYVSLPRLSLYLQENKQLYQEKVRRLFRLVLLLCFPVAIGLYALARPIIVIFAGEQYLNAVVAFQIFAIRIVFMGIESILYNNVIFLYRKEKVLLLLNLCCGILNVILNYLFLDKLTPSVAVFTTLMTEVLFQLLCLCYIKRNLHLSIGVLNKYNFRYLFISLFFLPIIYVINILSNNSFLVVLLSVFVCGSFYLLLLVLLKDGVLLETKERIACLFSK